MYPQVVGHEIVGTAIRVGKNVTHVSRRSCFDQIYTEPLS
jgi:D-arabinose 1-dehydrogenase-like Zn-dependent alcohol dehydrogenase